MSNTKGGTPKSVIVSKIPLAELSRLEDDNNHRGGHYHVYQSLVDSARTDREAAAVAEFTTSKDAYQFRRGIDKWIVTKAVDNIATRNLGLKVYVWATNLPKPASAASQHPSPPAKQTWNPAG